MKPGLSPVFCSPSSEPEEVELFRVVGRIRTCEVKGQRLTSGADLADAIGNGVVTEVGNAEEAFGGAQGVVAQDDEFGLLTEFDHREVHGRQRQGHEVAQALVAQYANVFETVGLLGKTQRFLDAPAREVGLDRPPESLAVLAQRDGREHHEGVLAKALDDQQPQRTIGPFRQTHFAETKFDCQARFRAVRVFASDGLGVRQRAMRSNLAGQALAAPAKSKDQRRKAS